MSQLIVPVARPIIPILYDVNCATVDDVPEIAAFYINENHPAQPESVVEQFATQIKDPEQGFLKSVRDGIKGILGYSFKEEKVQITHICTDEKAKSADLDLMDTFFGFAKMMGKTEVIAPLTRSTGYFLLALGFTIDEDRASTTVDHYFKHKLHYRKC